MVLLVANVLTNDALDPQAKIPEFKACAVQVFPAREENLPNPEAVVQRGRYEKQDCSFCLCYT
jgi:hypothetical protein